ncbi:MAG: heme d1 biosynthesis radical SAM protein NirJ [Rhodospirillaceae bacterium]
MMRLTRLLRGVVGTPAPLVSPVSPVTPAAPVVIWNLLRRCNLSCSFCYSVSTDADYPGELATLEILSGLDELRRFGVSTLVLSGGEPLLHPDLFEIAGHAKAAGFFVSLSTNGTLIDEAVATRIGVVGFDHVGISLDGLPETHDRLRGRAGAFDCSLRGLRLCRDVGLKVGVRFTLTSDNHAELPALLLLAAREGADRFYLSHLNYAGRGGRNRKVDAWHVATRAAMDVLIETALADIAAGSSREIVTGNNDADAVYLLQYVSRNCPSAADGLERQLKRWGGNSSGVGIANIDSQGRVHPDTMMAFVTLGSIRERRFGDIWNDVTGNPILAALRQRPRPVTGRCAACRYLDICNGNTRTRAWRSVGDAWAEDPGCYLSDEEISSATAES